MHAQPLLVLALCLTLAAACESMGQRGAPDHVDDALIADLSEEQMVEIREMRLAHDRARDQLARAERDLEAAHQLVRVAKTELSAAEERLEAAEARVATAQTHGTTTDLENAQESLKVTNQELELARSKVAWREQQITHSDAQVELTRANVALAQAELDLAKARAVMQLDRPTAQQLDLSIFERKLREQQTQVKLAEVKAEAALEEVNRVEASYRKSSP